MSEPRTLTLLGGQSTGKSTYLGALVDALQMEKLRHLRLGNLPENARGLLRLAEPLLDGHYPQRTKAGERLDLVAPLRTRGGFFEDTSLTLNIGDYDGEEVERLFRDRIHGWSAEWQVRSKASGLLLLVRPEAMTRLPRLQQHSPSDEAARWDRLRGVSSRPTIPHGRAPAAPPSPETVFGPLAVETLPEPPRAQPSEPVAVPTALSTIELLQFIRHVRGLAPGERPHGERRLPIALLVSAWDAADNSWRQAGPAQYLAQSLPLLADYLWSNFHLDDIFCFGLSATGGNLHDADYSRRYLDDPTGFVEWADTHGTIHRSRDIGLPLYWLLFGDRAFGTSDA